MTGQEAVELIHQRAWVGRKPGLERIRRLLGRLGNPQTGLKFVHIAGSNGKGSTAAMLASVLKAAGWRTGLYTSPHLWRFHERFQVDDVPISGEDLVEITAQVLEAAEDETEFELMTAIAFLHFWQSKCDIVVMETGLGGRLDSTNIIDRPEVAVITRIGLEHTQLLGDTLARIAAEKAGIIKPGCDVVLYGQDREVERVVERVCRERGVSLAITCPNSLKYRVSLLGEYQTCNAAVALEAVNCLRRRGWEIPEAAVIRGLDQVRWPGRMELAHRRPDVILDGAHNPQCMEALVQSLGGMYLDKNLIFLTGVLVDKDYPAMMGELLSLGRDFFTLTPDSPRALPAGKLAAYLEEQGATASPCGSVQEGLDRALAAAGAEGVVCVCGSLYLVGEARHRLGLC